jgi:LmbE family N-acetylglucosaminyl deacetylase
MENKPPDKKQSVLLVSAHPDDDTMLGGTLAKLAQNGFAVHEFVCTSGKNGKPNTNESIDAGVMAKNRESEIALFTEAIGIEKPFIYENGKEFLSLDDGVVLALVKQLRTVRPGIILLLNDADYHFEHRLAHEIGLRAIEIAFRSTLLELGPKLTDGIILKTDGLNVLANPLIHFNTGATHAVAVAACKKAYEERLGDLARFSEGLATMRGARVGFRTAEVFELVNPPSYKFTATSAEILNDFVALGSS